MALGVRGVASLRWRYRPTGSSIEARALRLHLGASVTMAASGPCHNTSPTVPGSFFPDLHTMSKGSPGRTAAAKTIAPHFPLRRRLYLPVIESAS